MAHLNRQEATMANVAIEDWRVQQSIGLNNEVEELLRMFAGRGNLLDNAILVFPVLTSGRFWELASDALPKPLGWIGAVISTIVTGLTIYMHTSAVNHKRKKAQLVTDDLGKFVAEVRTNPQRADVEVWRSAKFCKSNISAL